MTVFSYLKLRKVVIGLEIGKISTSEDALSIKKKRIMIYFIEATEKLIKEDGIDGLSIRRIASEAGYNSATLYNYFDDLEHLVLFASVRHLREYVTTLGKAITPDMNALQIYRVIYTLFCDFSFRSPEIFNNMFFGRYRDRLTTVLKRYYELFPDEIGEQKMFVKGMLSEGNIYERDLAFMEGLVEEGFVKPEKKNMTVQLLVRTHQSFLWDASIEGPNLDAAQYVEKFMKIFDYIMEGAV